MMLPMQFCCNLTRILFTNCVAKILKVPELRNLPLYPTNVLYTLAAALFWNCFATVYIFFWQIANILQSICNCIYSTSTVLYCTVGWSDF